MPADCEGLQRLEEATGVAFRFVIGKTKDSAKMSELRKEVAEYDDFLLLDMDEEYSKLPNKTLAFFKDACALYDSKFSVKAEKARYEPLGDILGKEYFFHAYDTKITKDFVKQSVPHHPLPCGIFPNAQAYVIQRKGCWNYMKWRELLGELFFCGVMARFVNSGRMLKNIGSERGLSMTFGTVYN
ncbi:hypothetical protein MLD38_035149 [Melastoma candidum]|uniref:Uncharacterized protein n=1 Tax=Melastoma candidum TaxID=119954 RepID=A0ACB9ME06_9MYRT|nr:hypothetical protein MLD38_035149 [Melastoma candidum]